MKKHMHTYYQHSNISFRNNKWPLVLSQGSETHSNTASGGTEVATLLFYLWTHQHLCDKSIKRPASHCACLVSLQLSLNAVFNQQFPSWRWISLPLPAVVSLSSQLRSALNSNRFVILQKKKGEKKKKFSSQQAMAPFTALFRGTVCLSFIRLFAPAESRRGVCLQVSPELFLLCAACSSGPASPSSTPHCRTEGRQEHSPDMIYCASITPIRLMSTVYGDISCFIWYFHGLYLLYNLTALHVLYVHRVQL